MATSNIKFYKINFPSDTNCYIDDIETFLGGYTPYTIQNFQYIKHDLSLIIKIPYSQDDVNDFDYNFCRVINSNDAQVYYYFVRKPEWSAPNTLKLNLAMDTINSLGQGAASFCNPRNFTNKTQITRQHEDRFIKPTTWSPDVGGTLYRRVSKETEGIVPNKIKVKNDSIVTDSTGNYDWYLIYRNHNNYDPEDPSAPNVVDTFLLASSQLVVNRTGGGAAETIVPSDLVTNQYYYVIGDENFGTSFTAQCDIYINGRGRHFVNRSFTIGGEYCITREILGPSTPYGPTTEGYQEEIYKLNNIKFWTDGTKIYFILSGDFLRNGSYHTYTGTPMDIDFTGFVYQRMDRITSWSIASDGVAQTTINSLTVTRDSMDGNIAWRYVKVIIPVKHEWQIGSQIEQTTTTIDDLDRTDSRLIKIIKYPYCPVQYTVNNGVFNFGDNWSYGSGLMKYSLDNLPSLGLRNKMSVNMNDMLVDLTDGVSALDNEDITNGLESKLYHSDFYTDKLVYDSFAKDLKYENFEVKDDATTTQVNINFKPTGTINSKFGFKIVPQATFAKYKAEQDFDDILLVTRNNEETILNNEYINYIKTGYNYDKKANALQLEQATRSATTSTIGTVLSAIGAIAAFAATPVTGGASAAAGVGLATAAVSGAVSTANAWQNVSDTQQKQETSMQAKLAQLAAQSTSTAGTDDVDLMSWYANNKLIRMYYGIRDEVKQAIYKKLLYTGYAHNRYEVPNVDSRIWYNFIQCNPELDYEGTKQLKSTWLADLKEKYNNGVTVFHKRASSYKLSRDKENYETWLLTTF